MRSIQTKFILLILVGIMLSSVLVGGIGIYRYTLGSNNKSAETINYLAETYAAEINGIMGRVEQSVQVIAGCAEQFVEDTDLLSDEQYYEQYMDYLSPIMLNAAFATRDSVSVYIRLSPEIASHDAGLFYIRTDGSDTFELEPNTDMSLYDSSDVEHVGWYYIPVANAADGQMTTWMEPYLNKNINVYMISYVVPIFCNDELLGIVGMDIDFTMLQNLVSSIDVYNTGFAYLADDEFTIVYHPNVEIGMRAADIGIVFEDIIGNYSIDVENGSLYNYEFLGVKKKMSYRKLNNNVNLVITAPQSEINNERNKLLVEISSITMLIAVVFILITTLICRAMIKPLRQLTEETKGIADGDYSVDIHTRSRDEIGTLADSFRDMAEKLQSYIEKINRLAHTDSLTGCENKTSYDKTVKQLEEKIENGSAEFAVVVLDINGLKETNDSKGHYFGDMLISNCANIIRASFPGCALYRIGGDEFSLILTDVNYSSRSAYMDSLDAALQLEQLRSGDDYVVLAAGLAEFEEGDTSYKDVFARADKIMYTNKHDIKSNSVMIK